MNRQDVRNEGFRAGWQQATGADPPANPGLPDDLRGLAKPYDVERVYRAGYEAGIRAYQRKQEK